MAIISRIKLLFESKGAAKATKETESIGRAQTRLGQASASAGRQFSAQASGMGGLVSAYAGAAANIFAITMAFSALAKAARAEETIAGVRTLAASVGESGDEVLAKLQEITQGQVSMAEAAASANLALSAGFSLDQIEGLATVATKASKALGRDLTDSLNRLVRGAAKVEPEILDELGIIVRLDVAVSNYAASVGKAASELTLFERSQAFTNAIITQGTDKFSVIDEKAASSIKTFEQLAAKLADFSQQLLGLVAGALGPLVDFITGNFLNTLAAAGLLGGIIFSKLAEVGGAALTSLATKAEMAGTRITNFLGKTGATAAANALTQATKDLKFSGTDMKGQFTGMTAAARTTAISLLAKSKTTALTAAEQIKLRAALQGTIGVTGLYRDAVNAATASTSRLGMASRFAAGAFGFAAKGVGLLAKGFSLLIGVLGKLFFWVSILQLLSSTIGKLVFGIDLFAKAGEKLANFFKTFRQELRVANDTQEIYMGLVSDMPSTLAAAGIAIDEVTYKTKSFWQALTFQDADVHKGAEAVEHLAKKYMTAIDKVDFTKLKEGMALGKTASAKRSPGTKVIYDMIRGMDVDADTRKLITDKLYGPGGPLSPQVIGGGMAKVTKPLAEAIRTTLLEATAKGIALDTKDISKAGEKLLLEVMEGVKRGIPGYRKLMKSAISFAREAGLSAGEIAKNMGDGLKEGLYRFSNEARESITELSQFPGFESLKKAIEGSIAISDVPEKGRKTMAVLMKSWGRYTDMVASGTITTEKASKEWEIQERVINKLWKELGGLPKEIWRIKNSMDSAKPAVSAFTSTLDFLKKSFDIKGIGKFREFVDGTGKLATTSRELKEHKFKQLGDMLKYITAQGNKWVGMGLKEKKFITAMVAQYPKIVQGVDKQRIALIKVTAQYQKNLDLLEETAKKQEAQQSLKLMQAEAKNRQNQLKIMQQLMQQTNDMSAARLRTQESQLEIDKEISNGQIAQLQHLQKMYSIEIKRRKLAIQERRDTERRAAELSKSVAGMFSNLFTKGDIQGLEIAALKINVDEAKELLAETQKAEEVYVANEKALLAEKLRIIEKEDSLARRRLINQQLESIRQETYLKQELAMEKMKLDTEKGEKGLISKEIDLRQKVLNSNLSTALINAEAAKESRKITLEKMKADATFLLGMANLLNNHHKALATVMNAHVQAIAFTQGKTAPTITAGTQTEEATKTIAAVAKKNLATIENLEGQSNLIYEKKYDLAWSAFRAENRLLDLEKESKIRQTKITISLLKSKIKQEQLDQYNMRLNVDALENKTDAEKAAARNAFAQYQKDSENRIAADQRSLAAAEKNLAAQKKLNDFINNKVLTMLNDLSGRWQNTFGTAFDTLMKAIDEGTLTLQNFKEGFKDFLKSLLLDFRDALMEEFVQKPLMDLMKKGMGAIGNIFGLKSAEDKKTEAQTAVYEAAQQSDEKMQAFMKANVQQVFVVNWPGVGGMAQKGGTGNIGERDFTNEQWVGDQSGREEVGAKEFGAAEAAGPKMEGMFSGIVAGAEEMASKTAEAIGITTQDLAQVGVAAVATFGGVLAATGDWKKAMLASFIQMFIQIAIKKAIAGMAAGGSVRFGAGAFQRFAAGGAVHRDRVPALLEPGEFVIRKPVARAIGGPALHAMNASGKAPTGDVQVNVTNTGTPQDVKSSDIKMDPKGAVVSIVLQDMKNNGPIRQSMRGKR